MRKTMIEEQFENPFDSKNYNLVNLCLFGQDTYVRARHDFPDESVPLDAALDRAIEEDAEVALALGQQRSRTTSVDRFLVRLHGVMRDQELSIAGALGGYEGEGYLSIYPEGLTGYNKVPKKDAPAIMNRITLAVNTYSAKLDAQTKNALLSLEEEWGRLRTSQLEKMGEIAADRVSRISAKDQLAVALWDLFAAVQFKHRKDAAKGLSYFREHLLKGETRGEEESVEETPATEQA